MEVINTQISKITQRNSISVDQLKKFREELKSTASESYRSKTEHFKQEMVLVQKDDEEEEDKNDCIIEKQQLDQSDQLDRSYSYSYNNKTIKIDAKQQLMSDTVNERFQSAINKVMQQNKEQCNEYMKPKVDEIKKKLKEEEYQSFYFFEQDLNELRKDCENNGALKIKMGSNTKVLQECLQKAQQELSLMAAELLARKAEHEKQNISDQLGHSLVLSEVELQRKQQSVQEQQFQLQEYKDQNAEYKITVDKQAHHIMLLEAELASQAQLLQNAKARESDLNLQLQRLQYHVSSTNSDKSFLQKEKAVAVEADVQKVCAEEEYDKEQLTKEMKQQLDKYQQQIQIIQAQNLNLQAQLTQYVELERKYDAQEESASVMLQSEKAQFALRMKQAQIVHDNEIVRLRTLHQSQLQSLTEQGEHSSSAFHRLLHALKEKESLLVGLSQPDNSLSSNASIQQIYATNQALAANVNNLQAQLLIMAKLQQGHKEMKKIVKYSIASKCAKCSKVVLNQHFLNHVAQCCEGASGQKSASQNICNLNIEKSQNNSESLNLNLQRKQKMHELSCKQRYQSNSVFTYDEDTVNSGKTQFFDIVILQVKVKEDLNKNFNNKQTIFTEYKLLCKYQQEEWIIDKRYSQIQAFQNQLKESYQNTVTFPEEAQLLHLPESIDLQIMQNFKQMQKRVQVIQAYLNKIARVAQLQQSNILMAFIEVPQALRQKINKNKQQTRHMPCFQSPSSNKNGNKLVASQYLYSNEFLTSPCESPSQQQYLTPQTQSPNQKHKEEQEKQKWFERTASPLKFSSENDQNDKQQ